MLIDRLKQPDDQVVIYHYCSSAAFFEIIKNRTLRFSDINLLNDAEEGRWGYNTFLSAANRILDRDNVPNILPIIPIEFIKKIDEIWHYSSFSLTSFVSCFSSEADSLSQWRAYADDGRGFSIGFNLGALAQLPVQILEVLYDKEQQEREMLVAIGALYMEMQDQKKSDDLQWIIDRCMLLKSSSIAFKNPAWREEKEIRCQHVVPVSIKESRWTINPAGGSSEGRQIDPVPVRFQVRDGGVITPYLDLPFENEEKIPFISEIWLGPKNQNALGNVKFYLGNNGFGAINLKSAGVAYR